MTKTFFLKKAIWYRIYSIIIMAAVFYLITGSIIKMTALTALVETVKALQYYFFEIIWHRVKHPTGK